MKSIAVFFTFFISMVLTVCHSSDSKSNKEQETADSTFIRLLHYDSVPFKKNSDGLKAAVNYIDSIYYRLKSPRMPEKLYRYDRIVTFFYQSRLYSVAIRYCDSIIQLIDNENAIAIYPAQYASAYFAAGDSYAHMGNFSKAYDFFFIARKRAQQYVDRCALSDYTYRIAISLYKAGQYNESMSYFKMCLQPTNECGREIKYLIRRQELLSNIGLCFVGIHQPDSALRYYHLAIAKIKNEIYPDTQVSETSVAIGVVYGNIGKAYLLKGDTALAVKYFKRNVEINSLPNHDSHDANFSFLNLAELHLIQKKYDEAAVLLGRVKASIDTIDYDDTRQRWLLLMSKFYNYTGNIAASNKLLNALLTLRDSIEIRQREFKEMDVRQYIVTLENQEENKQLKEENEKKRFAMVVLVGAGLFLLVLLVGGVYLYRRTQKYVTELTVLNQTIELQKVQLEQRNKDKDHILRIVAHDLRNPIWGINALSKILLDEMQPSDKLYENIRLIHGASHSTMTLINELIDATMDIDRQIQTSREDIYEVINNVVEVLKHRAAEKYQNLVWLDVGKSMYLSFNREKISRVLNNLIFNAIKFSHRGSNIEISLTATSENLVIAVKDHGVGIPAELQGKIFEMFTPAKRVGTAGEKSIGLGLSICRGIAEAHGGKLWLESIENKGTTFFLQLPIRT